MTPTFQQLRNAISLIALTAMTSSCGIINSGDSNGKHGKDTADSSNQGSSEIWDGACADSGAKLRLELLSESLWSLSNPDDRDHAVSGKYAVGQSDAHFVDNADVNIMDCEATDTANEVACKLANTNLVGFLNNCHVAKLKLTSSPRKEGQGTIQIPPSAQASLKQKNFAFSGTGTCNNRAFDLTVKNDGSFLIYSKATSVDVSRTTNPSTIPSNGGGPKLEVKIEGGVFEKDESQDILLFESVVDGKPSFPAHPDLSCTPSGSPESARTIECQVKNNVDSAALGCPTILFNSK